MNIIKISFWFNHPDWPRTNIRVFWGHKELNAPVLGFGFGAQLDRKLA